MYRIIQNVDTDEITAERLSWRQIITELFIVGFIKLIWYLTGKRWPYCAEIDPIHTTSAFIQYGNGMMAPLYAIVVKKEIIQWLDENCPGAYTMLHGSHIYFYSNSDRVLYHLTWANNGSNPEHHD